MIYLPLKSDKTPAVSGWNLPTYTGVEPEGWVGLRADGLVIVDCDSEDAYDYWIALAGYSAVTYIVRTPRGWHFYYRYTPGSPTGPAVGMYPGIDIRAGGGSYVVASCAPGYSVMRDLPLLPFDPSWLPEPSEPKNTGTGEGWTAIPEGQRNATLAAVAGTLRSRGMDATEIAKTINGINKAYCDPPLDPLEVRTIAWSIGRYEPESQTTIELVGVTPESHAPTGMWGDELDKFDPPDLQWVVPGLIPEGLTILAGKPKVGKSWMSLGLASACAEGGAYLERDVPKGKALYLALEDTLPRLKRRLTKVKGGLSFPPDLRVETKWPKCPDAATQIVAFMKDNPETRLVVIDTLAKVRHESSERASGTYQDDYAALGDLKTVADHFHIAVVLIHHTRKDGADDVLDQVSGTTGLAGAADTILVLSQERLEGRGRDLEEDIAYDVRLDQDSLTWQVLGSSDFTIVLDLAEWVLAHTAVGERVNRENARKTGFWSQEEFTKQWDAMRLSDPRFSAVRRDDADSPLLVAKPT